MGKQKRILIVRPDRIGDVVLSTPIPREIKMQFPGSFVAVLVRRYTKNIFLHNPYVDDIILIDDDDGSMQSFFKKAGEIRKYKFTHALSLLPTERINYMLFFAGIRTRVGVGHKLYQFLTFSKYVSRHKYIPLRHEADYCMDLARRIGVETENINPEIFLSEVEKKSASALRAKFIGGKKFLIGIHSTSGNSAPNWKPAEYKILIEKLNSLPEVQVIVTDKEIPEEIQNMPDVKYESREIPEPSLRDSIVLFSALDLLVSASTGPMHICAALGVKTVSLFCPLTACSPKLWGPLGNASRIILPSENYCSAVCPGDPKKCSFEGPGGIDAEKVFGTIKKELS